MTNDVPIETRSSDTLRDLPGYRIRKFAELWLGPVVLAQIVDAPLADLQAQWLELCEDGRVWRARWAAASGCAAICTGLCASGARALLAPLPRWAALGVGGSVCTLGLFALLSNAIRSEGRTGPTIPVVPRVKFQPAPIIESKPIRTSPKKPEPPALRVFPEGGGPRILQLDDTEPVSGPARRGPGVAFLPPALPPESVAIRSSRDSDAVPIVRIPPEYPPEAARRELEGFVVVRLWVGPSGSVSRAEVAQAEPRGVFERNTLAAVRRWKYRPGQVNGEAVERGPFEVVLNFTLDDAKR